MVCELTSLQFDDLKFDMNSILVTFQRRKQRGNKQPVTFAITDEVSRGLLSHYVNCFPEGATTSGRLFRKFNEQTVKPMATVIGEHKVAEFASDAARFSGKPSPENYTPHALRRTWSYFS